MFCISLHMYALIFFYIYCPRIIHPFSLPFNFIHPLSYHLVIFTICVHLCNWGTILLYLIYCFLFFYTTILLPYTLGTILTTYPFLSFYSTMPPFYFLLYTLFTISPLSQSEHRTCILKFTIYNISIPKYMYIIITFI
jgi:hypothetical protein